MTQTHGYWLLSVISRNQTKCQPLARELTEPPLGHQHSAVAVARGTQDSVLHSDATFTPQLVSLQRGEAKITSKGGVCHGDQGPSPSLTAGVTGSQGARLRVHVPSQNSTPQELDFSPESPEPSPEVTWASQPLYWPSLFGTPSPKGNKMADNLCSLEL